MKNYHLIGIGGIGMSGIAILLLRLGHSVSGSDLKENKSISDLKSLGVKIYIGHAKENINGADIVVYSSAIGNDNCEIQEAKKKGIILQRRAKALADLMAKKTVITVAGSHGKTTTTSLASCLLIEAGLSPTVAIGGILKNIDTNACIGEGDFFVAEADESDGSFLDYKPNFSIITNIDREHLDYYKSFRNQLDAFKKFIMLTDQKGCLFCCSDDKNLSILIKGYRNELVTFGLNTEADIYPENIVFNGLFSEFDCFFKGKFVARFSLRLGGQHNVSNALSVIALGLKLKIGIKCIQNALSGYKGARRRLEVKFEDRNFMVIDDYAHHPSEIKATLMTCVNLKPKRKLVIFQPHRFTRTKLLFDEFTRSFDNADYLFVTEIYPAGEEPIAGINGSILSQRLKEHYKNKQIYFCPKEEVVRKVVNICRPGDLIMTLGAGDISKISDELAENIRNKT
ncbi:MAG: UDP-N-acetylmuramate--L-alanine ligase [Candidatus Omnitrophica bacterium]|nr:UDP-N-acetylmuramate--L-alanine ligase [Candidatus Omnitrophota bacterium]